MTVGAEKFINTGDSRQLSEIMEETIQPILSGNKGQDIPALKNKGIKVSSIKTNLDNFSGSIYTVRGHKISSEGYKLRKSLLELGELDILELKPLEKIIDLIYKKVENYSNNLVLDVFETIKLCNELNLTQQGYTFLQENIINFLYEKCKDIANFYFNLGETRNDLNHAGYVNGPIDNPKTFNKKLDDYIDIFENIIINKHMRYTGLGDEYYF